MANDGFKRNATVITDVSCKIYIIVEYEKVTVYIKLNYLLKSSNSNNNNDKRDFFSKYKHLHIH